MKTLAWSDSSCQNQDGLSDSINGSVYNTREGKNSTDEVTEDDSKLSPEASTCTFTCGQDGTDDGSYATRHLKHKRRYCRKPGCTRVVKSQGLCQRHGAKPKLCRVTGCSKQAQGNFCGMCKSHFKVQLITANPIPMSTEEADHQQETQDFDGVKAFVAPKESVYERIIPSTIRWNPGNNFPLPLAEHLKIGFRSGLKFGWHRDDERNARRLRPVRDARASFEDWEHELVWTEILLLSGNDPSSFTHLAFAWGRQAGFQTHLVQTACHQRVEQPFRLFPGELP